ncbi:MAG: hypothetical protein AXW14_08580 [Alteromonas sp. Nap_26]|nr:MAG: hypothetical protein AXW14_08580 [Alteromonas sp. Nap_26]
MPHDIEFSVGDTVTYKPYHVWREMVVAFIETNATHLDGTPDPRVHYHLASKVGLPPVIRSTGLCLMESKHFVSSAWRVVIPGAEYNPNLDNMTQAEAEAIQDSHAAAGKMVVLHEIHTPVS